MAHGKGFAFLQKVDPKAKRPVAYAVQRFASSSYQKWVKIEDSYSAYHKTFQLLYPVRIEEEEYQYMITGFDFVSDLLAFLDTLEPVADLMLRVQSLDVPIWKLKQWWPVVKAKLSSMVENDDFPLLKKHGGPFHVGDIFKGVTLMEGWMIEEVKGKGKESIYTWVERSEDDVRDDRLRFVADLMDSIESRVNSASSEDHIAVLEVFDATKLISLQCGRRVAKKIVRNCGDSFYEAYGVKEVKQLMKVVSKMPHLRESEVNFDPRMGHKYIMAIKNAVSAGVWNGLCPHWFIDVKTNNPVQLSDGTVIEEFVESVPVAFEPHFNVRLSNGTDLSCRVHEQSVYASFYADESIYAIAEQPACILLDVALAKGGPEAIAESFYATMRAQQQDGGQLNDTLVLRTKLSWSLPSVRKCEEIIKESVKIYFDGDGTIKPHRSTIFASMRARSYDVSKVIDRIDRNEGKIPFLAL